MMLGFRAAIENDLAYLIALEEACMRDYVVELTGRWEPLRKEEIDLSTHAVVTMGGVDAGCVATNCLPTISGSTRCSSHPPGSVAASDHRSCKR